jgi:UPF0755 protein
MTDHYPPDDEPGEYVPRQRPPRRRVRKGRLLAVLLVLGLLMGTCGVVVKNFISDTKLAEGPVTIVIEEGMGAGAVADLLAEKGVIRNATLFKAQARLDDRSSKIRPGTYELQPGASFDDILTALTAAPSEAPTFTVTIPEGLTVEQTLSEIADAKGSPVDVKQLRKALSEVALPTWAPDELPEGAEFFEGMLFPNTYEFVKASTATDILTRLVEQTETVMDEVGVAEKDRYEVLTIGSLVEREARLRDEQPVIASVIYNRIDQGIRLQVDATVVYAKYLQTGEIVNRVLLSDLEIPSAWNTYQIDGPPPTPISGSGQTAIEAAANPDQTKYLYYVVSDRETGEHAFAETLEEHNANVARYREERAEEESGG